MDLIKEYAILAQKCYIRDGIIDLPENWTSLLHYNSRYGNRYALYVNEVRKEIVLGIKGTDNLFNYLSDAVLVAGAFLGNRFTPLGQSDVEGLAYDILEQDQHFPPNRFDAIRGMGAAIESLDYDLSPHLSNTVISDLYLSAYNLSIFSGALVSELGLISSGSSGLLAPNIQSLKTSSTRVKNALLGYLNKSDLSCFTKLKQATVTLLKNYQEYSLKIVGHSLGAVMAELCAVELEVECIGFESPGSKEIIENIERYRLRKDYIINTYLSAPNIINTLYGHPGNSFRMLLPHTEGGLSKIHALNCIFQSGSRVFTYASLGAYSLGKEVVHKGIVKIAERMAIKVAEEGAEIAAEKAVELAAERMAIKVAEMAAGRAAERAAERLAEKTAEIVAEKGAERILTNSLAGAIATKIAAGVTGLWKDVSWLLRQHKIDNIVAYLQHPENRQIKFIIEWPRMVDLGYKHAAYNMIRSSVMPLQKDLPGIRNILDEEGMREASIERMPNYRVINQIIDGLNEEINDQDWEVIVE